MDSEDASLVTGMLAPKRLDQLNEFLGASVPIPAQIDEPSLTTSSLHGLSLGDKVATLSALQPSAAAAILGKLCQCCHLDCHNVGSLHLSFRPACMVALAHSVQAMHDPRASSGSRRTLYLQSVFSALEPCCSCSQPIALLSLLTIYCLCSSEMHSCCPVLAPLP